MEKITQKDFDIPSLKFKGKNGIILFYYEWCPYCKEVKPTLQKYAELGGKVYIMEGEENPGNKTVFDAFNVTTVPDIRRVLPDGSLSPKYEGNRDVADFLKFQPLSSNKKGGKRRRRKGTTIKKKRTKNKKRITRKRRKTLKRNK